MSAPSTKKTRSKDRPSPPAKGRAAAGRNAAERRRAERRFELVVEAAPSALVMADERGNIVLANTQAERLFGYTRAELLALSVDDLVPERFRGSHHGHRASYDAAPSARSMGAGRDLFAVRKDGTEVPVEIGLNPLTEGEARFVLASIVDISRRKELERQLAHHETLATIGTMAASIGHEIRNPLSSIVMGAQALARLDLGAEERAHITDIVTAESRRLQRTLEDFLQFSRPRVPDRRPADLNAVAAEVLDAATAESALAGATRVERRFDAALPAAAFDHDQVRQVLWNLVRNALQALAGAGTLTVSTGAGGGRVWVRVEDDGPGIPKADRATVFTPFFTTKAKGTGLGLAICRNIVVGHGGELTLEPRERGCSFLVSLPR